LFVSKEEPSDSAEEILNGIKYVRPGNGFLPKFKLTQRIDVNGPKAHPIFSYLKVSAIKNRFGFN
jgi:glutathione peroxidase